jgi:hypothetical protein
VTFCEEREKSEKGVVGMRHRWTSAVLALLLAGLMCFSLTGCEVDETIDTSEGSTAKSVSEDKYEWISVEGEQKGRWVVTRTYTEDYVADQLQTSKDLNYCLEQAEIEVVADTTDEIKKVSLLYALNAKTYFNYLADYTDETENGLTKKADTTARRYVLITFEYALCTDVTDHGNEPEKVTIQYGPQASDVADLNVDCYTTVCDMDCDENKVTYVADSGHDLTDSISSYTTKQVMNAALRLALGQTAENTTGVATITTTFEDNLFSLAESAKRRAEEILPATKVERDSKLTN